MLVPRSGLPVTSYYRHGAERVDSARVTSLAVLRMGQTTGTGCRIPQAPAVPASSAVRAVRGTCWEVDLRRWEQPRLVAAGDQTLAR
jgi:hypothetical protein